MKRILRIWAEWRLNTALDELIEFQSRSDVGPIYLVNTLRHIGALKRRVESLSA